MNDRFWELIARNWSGEISADEKKELEQYLLEHPEYWLKAGMEKQLSYKVDPLLSVQETEQLADNIQKRIRKGRLQKQGKGILLATLISSILCFAVYHYLKPGAIPALQEITAGPGMKTSIVLADGTTVWLNAGSTLRYPGAFPQQDKLREVFLEGEGYFQVKADEKKPFIIHTTKMDIKVLGTAFNVRAYQDEDFFETALVQGAVEVAIRAKDGVHKFYPKPHQKIVARTNARFRQAVNTRTVPDIPYENIALQPMQQVNDSVIAETAWKEEKLVFRNETFEALALRLERWYAVKITIKNPALNQQRFSGHADNVSLAGLLDILKEIAPFEYAINNKEVIIQ